MSLLDTATTASGSGSGWNSASTGAAIQGGSGLIGGLIQAFGVRKQQKRQNAFTEKMYDKQRADSLADWNMQNAYNSPAAQMERLKAAGLNPNLVYQSGADAGSPSPVRSTEAQVPQQQNTLAGVGEGVASIGGAVMGYYNMKSKDAQNDNLSAMTQQTMSQTQSINIDNIMKLSTMKAEIALKIANAEKAGLDVKLLKETYGLLAEREQLLNNKLFRETNNIIDQGESIRVGTALTRTNISSVLTDIGYKIAQTALTRAQTQGAIAMVEKIKEDTRFQKIQNFIAQHEAGAVQQGWKLSDSALERALKKAITTNDADYFFRYLDYEKARIENEEQGRFVYGAGKTVIGAGVGAAALDAGAKSAVPRGTKPPEVRGFRGSK